MAMCIAVSPLVWPYSSPMEIMGAPHNYQVSEQTNIPGRVGRLITNAISRREKSIFWVPSFRSNVMVISWKQEFYTQ